MPDVIQQIFARLAVPLPDAPEVGADAQLLGELDAAPETMAKKISQSAKSLVADAMDEGSMEMHHVAKLVGEILSLKTFCREREQTDYYPGMWAEAPEEWLRELWHADGEMECPEMHAWVREGEPSTAYRLTSATDCPL